MKKLRNAMVDYAAKFVDEGFYFDEACFAVRLDEKTFMLSPLKKDKAVTAEDVVIVVMNDFDITGELKEKAEFFYDLFLHRKDVWTAGIFRSPYSFEICKMGKTVPPILDDMCQILATRIEMADNLSISDVLKAIRNENACHVKNLGMVIAERSLDELLTGAQVLEKSAECYLKAKAIGGGKHITKFRAWAEHLVFKNVYSVVNQKAQRVLEGINNFSEDQKRAVTKSRETGENIVEREKIVEILKRMSSDGLVQGTWGNVSIRLDDNFMICSPKGIGYNIIRPQDMTIVNLVTHENKGDIPATSERGIHATILHKFKHFNAVIHAHPTYASMFAAAHKELIIENEKDKELLSDKVMVSNYASPSTKALTKQTVLALGSVRAAFMANHGVIVAAEDIEKAYAALSRLEELCKEVVEKSYKEYLAKKAK